MMKNTFQQAATGGVVLSLAVLLSSTPAGAQSPGKVKVATFTATARPETVARGGRGVLTITASVAPGFHINAHKPTDPYLIGMTFQAAAPVGVTFGPPRFPTGRPMQVPGSKPSPVYTGRFVFTVPFSVARTAKPGRLSLGGSLMYQGCNAKVCYPPTTVPVRATVTVK